MIEVYDVTRFLENLMDANVSNVLRGKGGSLV